MNAVLTSSTNVWRASLMLALVTLLGFGLLYSLAATGIGSVLALSSLRLAPIG